MLQHAFGKIEYSSHSCLICRIFIGAFNETKNNWIFQKEYNDLSNFELYIVAVYFTVTTIMTVGYGDITAYNTGERAFCIILMLIGVVSFSYTTGSLASMIASSDTKEAQLKEKMNMLNDL